jgi:hypothetical protein
MGGYQTYRDLNNAPGHLTDMVLRRLNVQPYLNHSVSEGSTNGEISLPGIDGRLSAKQIPSYSVRRQAIC